MFLHHTADHIDILSGLFEIHFYYSVLFHILYNFHLMMLSAVRKCQVTTLCRVLPVYGVYFMLHFRQYNFEFSSRLLNNLCIRDLNKEYFFLNCNVKTFTYSLKFCSWNLLPV